jgi:hypothetical protein
MAQSHEVHGVEPFVQLTAAQAINKFSVAYATQIVIFYQRMSLKLILSRLN